MTSRFLCAIFLFLVAAILPVSAADWLVVAVPQEDGQVLDLSRPFHVILTNRTSHNLTVWKDSCSWGYFNLSFEFTGKDGKTIKVEKNRKVYLTRNGPSGFVVLPGCAYPMTVNLWGRSSGGATEWLGTEALRGSMKMKTLYQNTNAGSPETKQVSGALTVDSKKKPVAPIWIGRVASDPIRVSIQR